jgi:hypothetical protein
MFKFLAWDETKTRSTNGGYTDYPKLASARLDKMAAAETGRFLMVCALASDHFCPTYLSGATLAKDSNLLKEAAHYKVNAVRILCEMKEKHLGKSSKPRTASKLCTSPKLKRKRSGG